MKKRFRGPSWEEKSGEGMKCDDTKNNNVSVGDYFPRTTNLNGCITCKCKCDNINLQQFCSFLKVLRIHLDLW